MKQLKLALLQLGLDSGTTTAPPNSEDWLSLIDTQLQQAGKRGAQLLCIQQINQQGVSNLSNGPVQPDSDTVSHTAFNDETIARLQQRLSSYARHYRMMIVVNLTYGSQSQFIAIDNDGQSLFTASNSQFDPHQDTRFQDTHLFKISNGTVGLYIGKQPNTDTWQSLIDAGADCIIHLSNQTEDKSSYLCELEHRAAALNHGLFIAAINRLAANPFWPGHKGTDTGSSYIINPQGLLDAQLSYQQDALLVQEIDLAQNHCSNAEDNWQFADYAADDPFMRKEA